MPLLTWDTFGTRMYDIGLDRGVLYRADGSAIPWSGLTSVVEKGDNEATPVFFDGMKIQDIVTVGEYSATMKAITFPDEFLPFDGIAAMRPGFYATEQVPQIFGLSYRVKTATDLNPDAGYKIHIVYNVLALPQERAYETISNDASPVEFAWDLSATPEDVGSGFRPTAHFIFDTTDADPLLVSELYAMLYGDATTTASLPTMTSLVNKINNWYRVQITDNGDGTWTAYSPYNGVISTDANNLFTINQANATWQYYPDSYYLSDTKHINDITSGTF